MRFFLPAGVGAVLMSVLGVGWFTQPDRYARGYAPEQPIAYSHQLHAGTLSIPCLYCHWAARKSRHAGVPSLETCMGCHQVTKTDSPEIQQLAALYESGEPIRWRRVHALPDHTFFDHRPHVNAGVECQTCHGEVQTMEVLEQRMSMRMSNCLECHRQARWAVPEGSAIERAAENCWTCHR